MTQSNINAINLLPEGSLNIAPRGERSAPAWPLPRVDERTAKDHNGSGERGLIRPGHQVRVDQHATDAMRVKSPTRLTPGTRTDLQLLDRRRILRGEIERCRITHLDPLCYEAIFIFHQCLEMPETHHV